MLKFFAEKMRVAFALQKLLTFFQQKISEYCTVKPVLVVTSIKQPTCIKQPEESCPEIHRHIFELY